MANHFQSKLVMSLVGIAIGVLATWGVHFIIEHAVSSWCQALYLKVIPLA